MHLLSAFSAWPNGWLVENAICIEHAKTPNVDDVTMNN